MLQRLEVYREFAEELMDCYEWGQHVNADQDPLTVFEVPSGQHPTDKITLAGY